ncbi:MAG TPA: rhodanese-like domain-containing protein [Phnomibacter sp.]|nr:rhodanese-like domain-containing protein [Phnomibacter sp.]
MYKTSYVGGTLPVREVEPKELKEWLKAKKDIILIDVREGYEHDTFDIGGQLIPMGEVVQRRQEIPATGTVVLYCRKGVRSAIVIQRLQDKFGYTNLYNLRGGVENWILQTHY